nr:MAG TPA: hypothetical protein [Caudoviricetes sp.]
MPCAVGLIQSFQFLTHTVLIPYYFTNYQQCR